MSHIAKNDKHLMLFSGRAYPDLAQEVAQLMDTTLVPTRALTYANSEIYVRFEESVRGCDAFVIQSHTAPVNEWVMEQLVMVDALKRASAKRITVVAPFYPYARQDKKHLGREPRLWVHMTSTRCGLGRGVARRSGSCGGDSLGPSICGSRTALDGWWRTWLLRLLIVNCRVMPIRWAPQVGSMLRPPAC